MIVRSVVYAVLVATVLVSCSPTPEHAVPASPSAARDSTATGRIVRLSTDQAAALHIGTVRTALDTVGYILSVPGIAGPSPEHRAVVSAPLAGRVTAIHAVEGEAVRRGDVLFEIESLELADLLADYMQAQAEETYTARQLARTDLLAEKNISAQRTLEKAQSEHERAVVVLRAARTRLLALGLDERDLLQWYSGETPRPVLRVRSPLSGVVSEHRVDRGQAVAALERMASVVDPSTLFLRGFVAPEHGAHLRPGALVQVALHDLPETTFTTTIRSIGPAVDEASKSVTVYAALHVPGTVVRAGQNIRLHIHSRFPVPAIALPMSAVVYEGTSATVFVRRDDTTYIRRSITIAATTDDRAIIASGLDEGEEVAVSGVFRLKALARFEEFAD